MDMLASHAYRDQPLHANDTAQANRRYQLLPGDFCTLYRRHNLQHYGIDITITPENNVHNWLDRNSPHFKPAIHDAVFKYIPRVTRDDRFKLCISTREMRDAAWQYCHRKQLVLDGTFGLCSSRLLLWIALGVDTANNGVPVTLFLFSAPTGNRATHAGYDTQILAELLDYWRSWLEENDVEARKFTPFAAMTDTDAKERSALLLVWPAIILLLCKFHRRQCWTNKFNSVVGSIKNDSIWKVDIESSLRSLQIRYVPITWAE